MATITNSRHEPLKIKSSLKFKVFKRYKFYCNISHFKIRTFSQTTRSTSSKSHEIPCDFFKTDNLAHYF